MGEYWDNKYDGEWSKLRIDAMTFLEEEDQLKEIVRLVGIDSLSREERMVLETSKSIREDFLHQNSFHEIDTYASMDKQFRMLRIIFNFPLTWPCKYCLAEKFKINDKPPYS